MYKRSMKTISLFNNFRARLLFLSFFTGIIGGFIAIAYRQVLEIIETTRLRIFTEREPATMLLWVFAALLFAILVEYMVKKEPLISGSGIPQIKAYLINQAHQQPIKGLFLKFSGGAMGIFNGLSLGREGPSIQLGGLAGQFLGERFGQTELEKRTLVSAGASVGLAAAFNAPLAGVLFALEELYRNFSPLIILACTLSAVTGTLITNVIYGFRPVFPIFINTAFPLKHYWHLVVLGIVCGIIGALFNTMLISFSRAYKRIKIGKVLIPTLIALVLMFFFPIVLGGGHRLIEELLTGHQTLLMLLVILLVKMFFTFASYGTGIPGGIFLPMLSIGALLGAIYYSCAGLLSGFDASLEQAFILFGMVGLFTAIVKAPVTGIVLLVEMSRSVPSMLPLAVVAFSAYLTTEIVKSEPVYEILLKNMLKARKAANGADGVTSKIDGEIDGDSSAISGVSLRGASTRSSQSADEVSAIQSSGKVEKRAGHHSRTKPKSRYGKTLLELSIPQGSVWNGKALKEIALPGGAAALSIIRGEEEINLDPESVLYEGDMLIILSDVQAVEAVVSLFARTVI